MILAIECWRLYANPPKYQKPSLPEQTVDGQHLAKHQLRGLKYVKNPMARVQKCLRGGSCPSTVLEHPQNLYQQFMKEFISSWGLGKSGMCSMGMLASPLT